MKKPPPRLLKSEAEVKRRIRQFLHRAPTILKSWFPTISFITLFVCYGVGYFTWWIFFGKFDLNIGDFFSLTDYALLPINHPAFLAFIFIWIYIQIVVLTLPDEERDLKPWSGLTFIFANVAMLGCVLILAGGVAFGVATNVTGGYSAAFDVYISGDSTPIKKCGFIAETSKYYFCYDYSQDRPLVINAQLIERLVLVRKPTKPECKTDDCDQLP